MRSIRLRVVTPAQPPRYASARSPAAAGRRGLILLAFFCGFLLAFAAPPVAAQYVDDHNPIGVTGAFEGVITTGCAYNVLNHNARRGPIDDIVVPGAVGKYGLKMTRYYNSRGFGYGLLGTGWTDGYDWGWGPPNFASVVEYPNGDKQDGTCEAPVGVSDGWETGSPTCCPYRGDFRLADGGKVHFDTTNGYTHATAITDPYGQTTSLTYDTSGFLTRVTEPGGRYLQFNYSPVNGVTMLTEVDAYDGRGNRTDYVVYHYISISPGGQYGPPANCLTSVDYSDGQHAYYTYQGDNVPENPGPPCPCSIKVFPVLKTCKDVRYKGPMRNIFYEYQDQGAHGAITKENYWDGVSGHEGNGPMVSKALPLPPSPLITQVNFDTAYTEYRGDGLTRTFNYTALHLGRSSEDICPNWNPNISPAPSQFLLNYTDFQGHRTWFHYNSDWYIDHATDARGTSDGDPNYTTYYNRGPSPDAYPGPRGIGQITRVTHPDTTHVDYAYYDESPNISGHYLQQITDERGNITYHYRDGNHRITRTEHRDRQGNVLAFEEFAYANNNFGLLSTHHLPSTPTWNGPYEHFQYDNRSLLIAKTNATTIADWQTAINTIPKTTYIYYPVGPWVDRVQTMTLPANVNGLQASETYEYDKNAAGSNVPGRGLVTKIAHNDNNHTYQSFGYDTYGNKLWEENELRRRTSYTYDEYNRLLTITRPLNGITTYTYNPTNGTGSPYKHTTNNPDTITTATNIVTRNVYDGNFRKVSTAVGSSTTTFGYDNVGNPTTVTDPLIHTTTTTYDERNRKKTVTDSLNRTTTFTYDGTSNVVSILRPDNYTETKAYDAMNRLISHTVPKSAGVNLTTTFGYWPSGKLFWEQDPKGQRTYFAYNESDKMTGMYYPDPGLNVLQQWAYDDAHNLKNRTTVNGEIQSFTYDIRNRKIGMTWSNKPTPPRMAMMMPGG
jgi:YD repeat-containing protein